MKKNYDCLVADCSGNITIMVTTPTDRSDYKMVAQALLDNTALGGEQVAFILPDKMEMCGLEFCGNASRAFALYDAYRNELLNNSGYAEVTVSVSGCEMPLAARIHDAEIVPASTAMDAVVEMDMPVPVSAHILSGAELGISKDGLLVDMDGISHLILTDIAPSSELFDDIKSRIYESFPDMPAFGIMFCDTVNGLMTPVVYVKDVDTTYFEGSCASGSVAASFALAKDAADGIHEFALQQPEGALYTSVVKEKGLIEGISLKGLVTLSDMLTIEI